MEQSDNQACIGIYTSQFRQADSLGSGDFGSVYTGYQIGNSKNKVAIKLIDLRKSTFQEIMNEVNIMLNVRSQGTLEILGMGKIKFGQKNQDHFAIVTEKMDGSLRSLLQEKGRLTEHQTIEWGSKIVECYKYLYKAKIIHRYLKPENLLYRKVEDQIIFKIGDFGFSRRSKAPKTLSIKGKNYYMSPQQAKQGKYTDKTDVYAFGCMLFQFLVGSEKAPTEIFQSSGQINKIEVEKLLSGLGISKMMIQLIEGCLMYDQTYRLAWKDIFNNPMFQKFATKKKIQAVQHGEVLFKITPDTATNAWKQNKYRQDNANKNVCICHGDSPSQWLCSAQDLVCDGECVFTIKALKVSKESRLDDGVEWSQIWIGIMESKKKGEGKWNTMNHCIYLDFPRQGIKRPNQEQTGNEWIQCSYQPSLSSLPCLIECHVNRNQNTITWRYNGKDQAKSTMPKCWKDGRKLCAVVYIWHKNDCVEFM